MKRFFILNLGAFMAICLVGVMIIKTNVVFATMEESDSLDDDGGGIIVEPEIEYELPELFINAINPGYTIDGISNVGEMIELGRMGSDVPLSLAGTAIGYTNSSGNYSVIYEFPEHSWMTGERLLLRLASSLQSELAAGIYTKTLAFKAGLTLLFDDEIVDEVCWNGKTGCYKGFDSANPTSLVRDLKTGEFVHIENYEPVFREEDYYIENIEDEDDSGEETGDGGVDKENDGESDDVNDENDNTDDGSVGSDSENDNDEEKATGEDLNPSCPKLSFTEVLAYYVESPAEQFVEIYNDSDKEIILDGCRIFYKNKEYALSGAVRSKEYFVYHPDGFRLTKNPSKENTIGLVGSKGELIDELTYYNGQRKGVTYALIRDEDEMEWMQTYSATPGAENVYQQYRSCEEGKVINELTGNCVKEQVEVIKICPEGYFLNAATGRCKKEQVLIEKTCKEGYYLNESTGRCRKIAEEATTKICNEGYYLNPLTGRCKKIVVEEEKTCKEGYYLNPLTGRCKKVQENTGASYEITPSTGEEKSNFVALYAVIGVVALGAIYIIYEYRKGIGRFIRRILRK